MRRKMSKHDFDEKHNTTLIIFVIIVIVLSMYLWVSYFYIF